MRPRQFPAEHLAPGTYSIQLRIYGDNDDDHVNELEFAPTRAVIVT